MKWSSASQRSSSQDSPSSRSGSFGGAVVYGRLFTSAWPIDTAEPLLWIYAAYVSCGVMVGLVFGLSLNAQLLRQKAARLGAAEGG